MQGLGYAAIIEANSRTIGEEAIDVFGVPSISEEPPIVQILGPKDWWRRWFLLEESTRQKAGPWEVRFGELVQDIRDRLGMVVECVAMDNASKAALSGLPSEPTLRRVPTMCEVRTAGDTALRARAPMAEGGEGRLDHVWSSAGASSAPRGSRRRPAAPRVAGQARSRLGVLLLVAFDPVVEGALGCGTRLGHPDLVQALLRLRLTAISEGKEFLPRTPSMPPMRISRSAERRCKGVLSSSGR